MTSKSPCDVCHCVCVAFPFVPVADSYACTFFMCSSYVVAKTW